VGDTLVQNVGIEDLLIDNRVAGTGSVTVFNNAYNCWFKNIASIGGGSRSPTWTCSILPQHHGFEIPISGEQTERTCPTASSRGWGATS